MSVGGDAVWDSDAALFEIGEKVAPMHFGFREGAGNAENGAFAVIPADTDGDEGGAVSDDAVDTDGVIGGVYKQMGNIWKRTVSPFLELRVELSAEIGDLCGGDLKAAEFLHDCGDAPGANSLYIDTCNGCF